jgi:hypothetical protein
MANVPVIISRAIITRDGASPILPGASEDPAQPINPDGPVGPGGIGITLNFLVIGGVKKLIELTDLLDIPIYWEYNVFLLDVDGRIECAGDINIMSQFGESVNVTVVS